VIQRARYFDIRELLPKAVFEAHIHEQDLLWLLLDGRVIWTLDALRMRYGPLVANTWHEGGAHQFRGFRPWGLALGSSLSQHKFGRACDVVSERITAEEIRQDILAHPEWDEFKFIRAIEADVVWLHFDVRPWIGPILVVKP
jgi:hypothetical protein